MWLELLKVEGGRDEVYAVSELTGALLGIAWFLRLFERTGISYAHSFLSITLFNMISVVPTKRVTLAFFCRRQSLCDTLFATLFATLFDVLDLRLFAFTGVQCFLID